MLRWFWDNKATLLLALIIALTVWVAAVTADDPTLEQPFEPAVPIEYVNIPDGLLLVGAPPSEALLTVRAPSSVWTNLTVEDMRISVDLSGLGPGAYQFTLAPSVEGKAARVTAWEPRTVTLSLEPSIAKRLPVKVIATGEPTLGYELREVSSSPTSAEVRGPRASVELVAELRAELAIGGARESTTVPVRLIPVDRSGQEVVDVEILPDQATITVEIRQLERYRLVSVIPILEGQTDLEERGYLMTNVSVSPSQVILLTEDLPTAEALTGFVETIPLDLTSATGDIERRLPLNLPQGTSIVGDQTVLVKVSIAPIETSITITRALEVQGLNPRLFARPSPDSVRVILSGPLPTLKQLTEEDVRVILDLLDLGVGTYQITPQVIVLPTDIVVQTILPDAIEVTITSTPPATPTPRP